MESVEKIHNIAQSISDANLRIMGLHAKMSIKGKVSEEMLKEVDETTDFVWEKTQKIKSETRKVAAKLKLNEFKLNASQRRNTQLQTELTVKSAQLQNIKKELATATETLKTTQHSLDDTTENLKVSQEAFKSVSFTEFEDTSPGHETRRNS